MGGGERSSPWTGVKAREVARPEVAVPEVLIDANLPFADFDNFAVDQIPIISQSFRLETDRERK
jgi:hypothetical protein